MYMEFVSSKIHVPLCNKVDSRVAMCILEYNYMIHGLVQDVARMTGTQWHVTRRIQLYCIPPRGS